MCWRKVEDMRMGRIAQEGATLHPALQGLGVVRHVTPVGDQPTDLKAPVGIEIIHHPIIALHGRALLYDVREMGSPVHTGACWSETPHHLARRDEEGRQQRPRTMADVLMLALFWFTRLHRLGRVGTLENLHPCLFVGADHEASLFVKPECLHIELTDGVRFGVEVGIVAIEPVYTPVWFEVGLLQHTPETRATYGPQAVLGEGGDQIIETPTSGSTMGGGGFLGRYRQHIDPL